MEVLVLQDDDWCKELAPIFANTDLEVIWRIKVDWGVFERSLNISMEKRNALITNLLNLN